MSEREPETFQEEADAVQAPPRFVKVVVEGVETPVAGELVQIDSGDGSFWEEIVIHRTADGVFPAALQFTYRKGETTRVVHVPTHRLAEALGAVVGGGKVAAIPGLDDKREAEAALRVFREERFGEAMLARHHAEDIEAAFMAAWKARPRAVVFSAATEADAEKLGIAIAVAQESALLLDSVDRNGIDALDLSTYSRLRAVTEAWFIACGWTAEDLDAWLSGLSTTELAPGVVAGPGGEGERRLVLVVQGRGAEVADELDRLAEEGKGGLPS